ncbi:MAG TPA: hypothetical protein VGM81_24805 [Burkholderiaceae bacterium]|jgi:hypothetical protein
MQPLPLFILAWALSGGLAWRVAKNRHGDGPMWAALGQVFGPFAIPFAFMVKRKV